MTGNVEFKHMEVVPTRFTIDLDDIPEEFYEPLKHEIVSPLAYSEELVDYFLSDPDSKGAWLPFGGSHQLRFRPQETTIWSGQNFTGKSNILLQAAIHWIQGNSNIKERVLLISPEMSVMQSLARMIRLMTSKIPGQVTEPDVMACLAFLEGNFWQLNVVGQVGVGDLNNAIRYAAGTMGVTQIIIDNLSVLMLEGGDPLRAQQDLMAQFVHTSRTSNCHVHLIAHDRKPGPGDKVSRYNISGSGALSNLADSCIAVVRNEKKAERLADINLSEDDRKEITAQSDGKIVITKQRHGTAWTGTVKLYFSPYSTRFSERRDSPDLAIPEIKNLAELGPTNTRGYGA